MFPILAILILGYFAYKDYKTGLVETKELWPMYLISLGIILLFGNILLSIIVALAFGLIMFGFQKAKITFLGDTLVYPLIALLYPNPIVLLIGLTTGFVLTLFAREKKVCFLPRLFIGLLFGLLTSMFLFF